MRPVLGRWQRLLLNVSGCPASSALRPTPPPPSAPAWRIRTDAALQGTPRPGIGGWLYGSWWVLPLAARPELAALDIPHLEFLAAAVSTLTFADVLQHVGLRKELVVHRRRDGRQEADRRGDEQVLVRREARRDPGPGPCRGPDSPSDSYSGIIRVTYLSLGRV